jgi:predicted amidohydrolase
MKRLKRICLDFFFFSFLIFQVPFVEGDVQPGDGIMQVADTEHGRIGAAICFDYDNARFIRQASTKGVDIMLQPSENW